MENRITVFYSKFDNDINNDLTGVTCFEREDEFTDHQLVAYGGKTAEELIKIVTEDGYLHELLNNLALHKHEKILDDIHKCNNVLKNAMTHPITNRTDEIEAGCAIGYVHRVLEELEKYLEEEKDV